jgi:nicotinamide mononucleotide transporter
VCRTLTDFMPEILEAMWAMWPWEAIAVVLAIIYLLLAIRQNIFCWVAAVGSTMVYLVLMFRVGLYMESALQLFYIAMAIYGWYCWRGGSAAGQVLQVENWPLAYNILPLVLIAVATGGSGMALDIYTDAQLPYLDSFTTWGAIVSTWMTAKKIIQNWHYWFVIDSVSIYLYASRGLWLTVMLFTFYLVLIVIGLRAWRKCLPMQMQ